MSLFELHSPFRVTCPLLSYMPPFKLHASFWYMPFPFKLQAPSWYMHAPTLLPHALPFKLHALFKVACILLLYVPLSNMCPSSECPLSTNMPLLSCINPSLTCPLPSYIHHIHIILELSIVYIPPKLKQKLQKILFDIFCQK